VDRLEHDGEKLHTSATRSCSKSNAWERCPIRFEAMAGEGRDPALAPPVTPGAIQD
jgi:hypothetical protein